jgi:hypothetical protein
VRPPEIVRQPIQIGRIHLDGSNVFCDVLAELLTERHELLAKRFDSRTLGVIEIDTRPPEVAQRPLDVEPRRRVSLGHIEIRHRAKHGSIE